MRPTVLAASVIVTLTAPVHATPPFPHHQVAHATASKDVDFLALGELETERPAVTLPDHDAARRLRRFR